jgi:hypothetical protein
MERAWSSNGDEARTQEMEEYGEKVREWACALAAAAYL